MAEEEANIRALGERAATRAGQLFRRRAFRVEGGKVGLRQLLQSIRGSDDGLNRVVASALLKLGLARPSRRDKTFVERVSFILSIAPKGEVTPDRVGAVLREITKKENATHAAAWDRAIAAICTAFDDARVPPPWYSH